MSGSFSGELIERQLCLHCGAQGLAVFSRKHPRMSNPKISNAKMSNRVLIRTVP